jgi:serine/threonine protein phosphatase PrpC
MLFMAGVLAGLPPPPFRREGAPLPRRLAVRRARETLAVTRMLGATPAMAPLPSVRRWQPGDAVLLVTDGVSDRVVVDELASIVLDAGDAETAARGVVACALDAGGGDNATAMVVRREA